MRYPPRLFFTLTIFWSGIFVAASHQVQAAAPAEGPMAHGKPLRYWIDSLKDPEVLVREEGVLVLADLGPAAKDAVPELTKLLKDGNLPLRLKAAVALFKIDRQQGKTVVPVLCEGAKQGSSTDRVQAVQLLGQIGPDAKEGCITLLELLTDADNNVRSFASQSLNQIGEAAVPVLQDALTHKDVSLRHQAAETLGRMGLRAKPAVPALTERLKDDDVFTRVKAAQALWLIEHQANVVVPVLADAMQNKDPGIRRAASTALYQMQPRPKETLPLFVAALKDDDALTRVQAAQAVWEIDRKVDEVMPALLEILKNSKDQATALNQALMVLGQMGVEAKAAVPTLIEILKEPNHPLGYQVANTLGQIGPPAVPALAEMLGNKDAPPNLLFQIIQALGQVGPEGADALVKALDHENQNIRQNAAYTIGRMGPAAKPAIPRLIDFLNGSDVGLRNAALSAVAQIGLDARAAMPALVENLKSTDQYVVTQSIQALRQMHPDAKTVLPALADSLKSANLYQRAIAADLIVSVDKDNPEVAPVLIELLRQRNMESQAAITLGHMGAAAKDAVPELTKLLRNPSQPYVRNTILQTLSQIGPEAKDAVPALLDLLKTDRDVNIRNFTVAALKNIKADAKDVVPVLINLAGEKDPNPAVKHSAIDALGQYGKDAKDAIPALKDLLKQSDLFTRLKAADALTKIAPDEAKEFVVPVLEGLLGQPAHLRTPAAQILLKFDHEHPKAWDALLQGLKDPGDYNRQQAADVLAQMGEDGKKAIPALRDTLKDAAPGVRTQAALALWKLDKQTATVLPVLTDSLKQKTVPYTRQVAANALGALGSDAIKAVPDLLEARKDRDVNLRNAATEAIKKIDPEAYAKIGMPEK